MSDRRDPLVGYHFYVEIQGVVVGAFREASGLTSESEVIEYKASGPKGEEITIKQPGRTKYPNINLKRGMTDAMDIWEWRKKIEDGQFKDAMKNGSIVLYDQAHSEVARWNFENAWPTKVSGPQLNAGNNDIAVEELEITHERLTRVK
jgi:phage tail-like protein